MALQQIFYSSVDVNPNTPSHPLRLNQQRRVQPVLVCFSLRSSMVTQVHNSNTFKTRYSRDFQSPTLQGWGHDETCLFESPHHRAFSASSAAVCAQEGSWIEESVQSSLDLGEYAFLSLSLSLSSLSLYVYISTKSTYEWSTYVCSFIHIISICIHTYTLSTHCTPIVHHDIYLSIHLSIYPSIHPSI